MARTHWIRKLLNLNTRSNRRRQAAQQRRPLRLNLEGLEERITPNSTITVSDSQGGGGISAASGNGSTMTQDPFHAAIEVAIDTADYLLQTQGNFTAVGELQILSVVFLGKALATNPLPNLFAELGQAHGLALPAIMAGVDFYQTAMSMSDGMGGSSAHSGASSGGSGSNLSGTGDSGITTGTSPNSVNGLGGNSSNIPTRGLV